jgi:hypothetical protein
MLLLQSYTLGFNTKNINLFVIKSSNYIMVKLVLLCLPIVSAVFERSVKSLQSAAIKSPL